MNGVYIAKILNSTWHGNKTVFSDVFELNKSLVPNSLYYFAAAGLLEVLSPATVEKLLGSLFLLGWPLACYFALKPISRFPTVGTILLLPIAYSQLFALGFYSYCFALMFMMVGLGLWFRAWLNGGFWYYPALALIALIGYFTHLFPAANLLSIIGFTTAIAGLAALKGQGRTRRLGSFLWSRGLPFFIALLPVFVLILQFLQLDGNSTSSYRFNFEFKKTYLIVFGFYLLYARTDLVFSALIAGAVIFAGYHNFRRPWAVPPAPVKYFGWLLLIYLALYFLLPKSLAQASFIPERLFPVLYSIFVCYVASRWREPRVCHRLAVYMAMVVLTATAYRLYQVRQLDAYLSQYYRVADVLRPNRSLLAIAGIVKSTGHNTQLWNPFFHVLTPLHISARISVERDLVDLKLVQSHFALTPVLYKKSHDPYFYLPKYPAAIDPAQLSPKQHLKYLSRPPQLLDLSGYEVKTGLKIDYVLLWKLPWKVWPKTYNSDLQRQLAAGYRQILLVDAADIMLFERKASSP